MKSFLGLCDQGFFEQLKGGWRKKKNEAEREKSGNGWE